MYEQTAGSTLPRGAAIGCAAEGKEVTVHEQAKVALNQLHNLINRLEQFSSRCGTNDRNPLTGAKETAPQPDSLKWTVVGINQAINQAHSVMTDIERIA